MPIDAMNGVELTEVKSGFVKCSHVAAARYHVTRFEVQPKADGSGLVLVVFEDHTGQIHRWQLQCEAQVFRTMREQFTLAK